MAQLKIDIIIDENGEATEKLAQIEKGVKGVEQAASKTAGPIDKVVKAITAQGEATDKAVVPTVKLEQASSKMVATLGSSQSAFAKETHEKMRAALGMDELQARSAKLNTSMAALTATSAAQTSAVIAVTAAVSGLALVAAAELSFLYAATKAYVTKSGILDNHATSIEGVKDAWNDLLFDAGQALVGSGQNFNGWINTVEVGLRLLGISLAARIDQAMRLAGFLGLLGGPNPANARQDANGDPTAYGRMLANQARGAMLDRQRGGDFARPSAQDATRQFDQSERAREAAEKDALRRQQAAAKLAEAEAQRWQDSLDKLSGHEAIQAAQTWMAQVGEIGDVTRLAAKDQDAFNKALGDGIDAMLRMGQVVNPEMLRAWAWGLGPGVVNGIRATDAGNPNAGLPGLVSERSTVTNLPGLFRTPGVVNGLSNLSQLPGIQSAAPTPPRVSFGAQAFGTPEQVGQKIGDAFAFAVQQSRSLKQFFSNLLGGIGSIAGGDLGAHFGRMAKNMGGMLGGALSSILPGIGSMLGGLIGPLADKLFGPTAYETRTRDEAAQRAQIAGSMDMAALQRSADFTGRQDLLSGVTSGLATKNDPTYISGLLTQLQGQHDQLNAAMDRYGISWEQLGEKAKQSQINQMAEQFVLDFQLLTHAGADVNFVVEKMGTSINEFLNTAIRTGTEVPIAMQPLVNRMSEMGTLTADLGQITWAESMTMGFNKVADAINHLAQALGFQLPAMAQQGAAGMNAAFDSVRVPKTGPYEPVEEPEFDTFHNGGMLWRKMHRGGLASDEVPIIGQTGEFMMSRRGVRANGTGVLNAMNAGQSVGGGGNVTIVIERDGEREAQYIMPFIANEAYRLGLVR